MNRHSRAALRARLAALSEEQRRTLARAVSKAPIGGTLVAFLAAEDDRPTAEELQAFLADRLPEYMVPSRYVALERLPRTAAGKLDRDALADAEGLELSSEATQSTALVGPRTEVEARLAKIWADVLGTDEISVHDDFFEIGGDSLLSIRVIARAGKEGLSIGPETFFDHPTIAALAGDLAGPGPAVPTTEQGTIVGRAPLTPIQHWFFERITRGIHHWNQAVILGIGDSLDADRIRETLRSLASHHDALRLRFIKTESGWLQEFMPEWDEAPLRVVELGEDPADWERTMDLEATREHASLALERGPLFRAVLFEGGGGFRRLLILAHHLLMDAVSWGILLEDLAVLLRERDPSAAPSLPPKTTSAKAWAEALVAMANRPETRALAPRWLEPARAEAAPLRVDFADGANRVAEAERVSFELTRDETSVLMDEATARFEAPPQELLLAALLSAWRRVTGGALRVDVEGHGRDLLGNEADASRTIGWFTTVFPLYLEANGPGPGSAVRAVRDAFVSLPLRGASHGLRRHLGREAGIRRDMAAGHRSEVLFNYLGATDEPLPAGSAVWPVGGPLGQGRSFEAPRAYSIEINTRLEEGRLKGELEYSRGLHRRESIDSLLEALIEAIRRLGSDDAGSAFDLAGLDSTGLDQVARLLAEIDEE